LEIGGRKCEGDEGGARRDDVDAELAGERVGEAGSADFGDGWAAGGNDEAGGGDGFVGELDFEVLGGAGDGGDVGLAADFDAGIAAFGEEHVEDLLSGTVAEELAEGFLVPGDAVVFDEGEEVLRGVAGEGGFGEVGIGGEEVSGAGVAVGEVATAAAGDEDFAARLGVVFEDKNAKAAAGGVEGAEEAGGAGAEDDGVKRHGEDFSLLY